MKVLYAEFTVKPTCEAELAGLLSEFSQRVRLEPGNIAFVPYTLTQTPRAYIVFETYRDDEAFREHLASDHNRRFNAALAGLIETAASTLTWLTPFELV